ncbi:hypothetical protein ACFLS1_08900, partial [Verrucomicrobiota bacterium]
MKTREQIIAELAESAGITSEQCVLLLSELNRMAQAGAGSILDILEVISSTDPAVATSVPSATLIARPEPTMEQKPSQPELGPIIKQEQYKPEPEPAVEQKSSLPTLEISIKDAAEETEETVTSIEAEAVPEEKPALTLSDIS